MFNWKGAYYIFVSLIALFSVSCSEYSKIMKSPDSDMKYRKVFEYYEAEDYYKALGLIEDIKAVYKGTDKYETLCFYNAYCNYQQKEYSLAGYLFKEYARLYSNTERTEEAEYMSAYCHYLISPNTSLEQTYTEIALKDMQGFIEKYPESPHCAEIIARKACFEENELWEKAHEKKTREAYEAFASVCSNTLCKYEGCEAISAANHKNAEAVEDSLPCILLSSKYSSSKRRQTPNWYCRLSFISKSG